MAASTADPEEVRQTLLAILKQLNQAEARTDVSTEQPALELAEIEEKLRGFAPVGSGSVKVALAVGLLLRNGLIETHGDTEYSWQRGRAVRQRYQITAEGKRFLVDSIQKNERIG